MFRYFEITVMIRTHFGVGIPTFLIITWKQTSFDQNIVMSFYKFILAG